MSSLTDSPFNGKMDSFFGPSDIDIAHIHALLVAPIAERTKLDAEISKMEVALAELKAQRDALRAGIAAHQSLLAPIRRIPQHALEEIFLACLPTAHNPVTDPSEAPLLLGRVCRYWRELSHSTPTLWNRIHVSALETPRSLMHGGWVTSPPPTPASAADYTAFSALLSSWILRSAAAPFNLSYIQLRGVPSLRASNGRVDNPEGPTTYHSLLPMVQKTTPRLQSLDIRANIRDWAVLLGMNPSELPMLRRLRLVESDATSSSILDTAPILAHPRLEYLDLRGIATYKKLPCNWANLVELRLVCLIQWTTVGEALSGGFSFKGAHELLLQCSRLRSKKFSLGFPPSQSHSPQDLASHIVPIFLRSLHAPTLSVLNLGKSYFAETTERVAMHSPTPQLAVSFLSHVLTDAARADILRAFTGTTSLYIWIPDSTPQSHIADDTTTCERFFTSLAEQDLCPLLQVLFIMTADTRASFAIAHTGIVPFTRSRYDQGAALKIRVRHGRAQAAAVEEELRELREMDIDLKVECIEPEPAAPAKWKYNARAGLSIVP
ncbi:Hexose carrier protein [Mycena kentingensis (nom. inval.)]|nr:Hexose carrier protein [Mycena kentingensis (nom. inval.)]